MGKYIIMPGNRQAVTAVTVQAARKVSGDKPRKRHIYYCAIFLLH